MARKPRIEFEGATYHVMCRGNRQMAVFRDDHDCEMFLDTLAEVCVRCGWRVHAFVLMGNHYHLLLETPEANLVFGMQWLQSTYTKRFNIRHAEWGHLFQSRYKALLVDEGDYFSTVATYIHLNPARVRGFDSKRSGLEDHVWSSYPGYIWLRRRPEWLCTDRVLGTCGFMDSESGRRAYRALMDKKVVEMGAVDEPWLLDERWAKIRRGWCFGEETFRQEMDDRLDGTLNGKKRESFSGDAVCRHDFAEAERLIEQGLKCLGIGNDDLEKMKKNCPEKYAIAWMIRRHTAVRPQWIKKRLKMGAATNFAEFLKRMQSGEYGHACYEKVKNIVS